MNGDGITDLAVGAYGDGSYQGAVHVLFMNANGSASSSVKISNGNNGGPTISANDYFGWSVASLGDIDGDGITDLAVGARNDDTGVTNGGAVHVLFMNSNGTVKSLAKIASGSGGGPTLASGDQFGGGLAAVGDQDGNGITDLAVGAIGDDTGAAGGNRGAIHLLLLNAAGVVTSSKKIASGLNGGPTLADGDRFGSGIAFLGSLDSDGIADLAVGANLDDTGASDRGAVYTLFLKSPAPEIDVRGNGVSIVDGDGTPALADHTDFGSVATASGTITRTFTVVNEGSLDVTLSGSPKVLIGGANGADFTVAVQPAGTIGPSNSTTFQITFNPSAVGTRTATVSIDNNDANENPYNFTIQGFGLGGFTVTEIGGGATSVSESGSTDTISVVLDAQPASDVVISVVSNDTGEATVSPATLTFTTANWNVAQIVTVTGVDDPTVDSSQISTLTFSVVDASSDDAFDPLADQLVSVTTTDNDSAGFSITQTGGTTSVNESGTTDSFDVVLTAQPLTDVVFMITNGDATEETINKTTLTFTFANWNVAQTVTVTGVEDFLDDGDILSAIAISVDDAASQDLFDPVADQAVVVTTVDDDTAGFTITQSGGTTSVNESGTTDSFSVVLTAQPTSDVVITVISSDTGEATVSPATLTFTTGNWNVAQTVTVTGADDFLIDGDQTTTITLSIDDANSDNVFDPVSDQTVSATTIDDDAAGFTVTQSGGATAVNESGTTDTFTVKLNAQPASNVVITVTSGDLTEATVAPLTLTFTPGNWNTAQTVTVTGVDDPTADGDLTTIITLSINDAASDDMFDPVTDQTVSVTTIDNEIPGFSIVQSGGVTSISESGTTDTFTVVLISQPLSDVVITVNSGDSGDIGEATVGPATLTFTPANWNVPQTVTVTGVDDPIVDATQTTTITLSIDDINSNDVFDSVVDQTVLAATTDNDSGFFSVADVTVTEGSDATFTITLSRAADVTTSVTFSTSDGTAMTGDGDYIGIAAQVVTFLAGETSHTVTVSTNADSVVERDESFAVTLGGLVNSGRNLSISGTNGAALGTITNDDSADFRIADVSAIEGIGLTFTITLSDAVDIATSVTFTTSDGTAKTSDADYSAIASQAVTFLPGETSHTVTVNTTADNVVELDETFTATLGGLVANGRSVTISGANGSATGTILNDDSAVFSIADASAIEGNDIVFTITLSNPVDVATSVTVTTSDGTATLTDNDYSALTSQVVSFAAGQISATVTVNTTADFQVEADEIFTATLGGLSVSGRSVTISGTNNAATGTILNDDGAIFSIANASAIEGNGVVFTVTLSQAVDVTTSVKVTTSNGTATTIDNDYTAVAAQTIVFLAGETSHTITVNTTADSQVERDETFTATLGSLNAGGRAVSISGANGAATGTILNDDTGVFSISNASALEGNGVTFTITLTNPVDAPTSVTVTASDGSAKTSDSDYSAVSAQVVTFAAGQLSQTITVNTTADFQVELDETFTATLGGLNANGRSVTISGSNGTATGTILNEDSADVSIADASAIEGTGIVFTITLSYPVDVATSVTFTTSDGSATLADNDYTSITSQTVTFAAGQTTQTVTVLTTADTQVEGDETFTATLGGLSNAGRNVTISSSNGAATGTILTNDSATFSIANGSNVEGNNISFTITLSNPVDVDTSITFTTSDGTAELSDADYTGVTAQTVVFTAGVTSRTIAISSTADNKVEADETFTVTLGNLNNGGRIVAISGVAGSATGTILNDDQATFSIADASNTEGAAITFTVTLSNPVDANTSVTVTTSDGSAMLSDSDYTAVSSQTILFLAGETSHTIGVNTTADSKVEADETLSATLGGLNAGGRNVVLSSTNSAATGTIVNDDGAVFSISGATVVEGLGVTFTISLSTAVDVATSVTVTTSDGSATTADNDYTAVSSQLVSFAAGQTSRTVTISTTADSQVEGTETFLATLGGLNANGRSVTISGTNGSASGTILDNDSAVFSIASASATEGNGVTFTIALSNPVDLATSVTVTTADGSAFVTDGDYTAVSAQTVTFAPGVLSRTITISTTPDNKVEGDETFSATLGGLNSAGRSVTLSATNGSAIGAILNDDSAVFSIANVSAVEGTGLVFTITLSNPVDTTTSVTVTTADGTALVADSDYFPLVAQLVSFAAGVTSRTVTVNTNTDLKVESNETLTATLGGLSNGGRSVSLSGTNDTATGTILNDDTDVSVSVAPGSVVEDGLIPLVYTFTRVGVLAGTLNVNFNVGGSAALTDYSPSGSTSFTATAGSVSFANGSSTAIVSITPTIDSNTELDETVVLTVAAGAGYSVAALSNSATGTIRDDDAQVSMSLAPSNVTEDGSANLVYTLNRVGSLTGPLTVNFNVGGTASFGSDYSTGNATSFSTTTGSITFGAGASSVTLVIDPAVDSAVEADETVSIALSGGSGYLTPSPTPVIGTIDNDDFNVVMTMTPASLLEDAPGTFAFTLTRTGGLNQPLYVSLGVGGTALFGFDYSQTGAALLSNSGGVATFAPGANTAIVSLDPLADFVIESDETIDLTLLSGAGYVVGGTATYRATIFNDDQQVSVSSATPSVTEDGAANLIVTFTRVGATSGALSIPMTLGGSATFNTDYAVTGNGTFSAGGSTLLFAAGVTTATLTINPASDTDLEPDEVVLVTLPKNPQLGVPADIVAPETILNDDAIVNVSVTPDRVAEDGTSNLVYTFQRFGDTSPAVTVNFTVTGTATFGTDYTQSGAASFTTTAGSVLIPAGATSATVTLDPTPDALVESNETAILTVLPGVGLLPSEIPGVGTIINQVPTVSLSLTPAQLSENSPSNFLYKFTRAGDLSGSLTVPFSVGGSATFASDYLVSGASNFTATEGSITFADGVATATLIVDPQTDSVDELTETVVVTILPNSELFKLTGTQTATASITDAPLVSLAVSPGSVTEDGVQNLQFTFTRGGSTSQAMTVNFSVSGSAKFGTDYSQTGAATFSVTAGTVTIPAGSATKTVTIDPTTDFIVEADETIVLTIVSGNGYSIAGDNSATGIIANDDVDIGNVVTLDRSGRLHITDPLNRDDRLTVTKNGSNELVITDSVNRLTTTVGKQISTQEVRVPLASIKGVTLIVELNGGADSINLSGLAANLLKVTVYGGTGDDTIIGSAGNDTLLGGDGNDSIEGGAGNDGITGDSGNDILNGNDGSDSIMGGTGNDYLLGGAGNDRLAGQDGDDTVVGQGGVDRIAGGSGFGRDFGDVVTDNLAEIDEAFRISFNGTKFLLI